MSVKMTVSLAADDYEKLVKIADVESGSECGAVCPDCKGPLVAKKGEERAHHFAHLQDPDSCSWGVESELHLLAKLAIAKMEHITVPVGTIEPVNKSFPVESTELELKAGIGDRRPDVIVYSGGDRLLVEVAVTHFADRQKILEYKRANVSAIEVDFSDLKNTAGIITEQQVASYLKDNHTTWLSVAPSGVFGESTHDQDRRSIQTQNEMLNTLKRETEELERRKSGLLEKTEELRKELQLANVELQNLSPEKLELIELRRQAEKSIQDANQAEYQAKNKISEFEGLKSEDRTLVQRAAAVRWSLAKMVLMQRNVNQGKPELEDIEVLHWVDNMDELITRLHLEHA